MISKELLSEVLSIHITKVLSVEDNILQYEFRYLGIVNNKGYINIHELAHKYINHFYDDYIFSLNAYQVIITKIEIGKEPIEVHSICWLDIPYDVKYTFQACQWIVDNKTPLNKK